MPDYAKLTLSGRCIQEIPFPPYVRSFTEGTVATARYIAQNSIKEQAVSIIVGACRIRNAVLTCSGSVIATFVFKAWKELRIMVGNHYVWATHTFRLMDQQMTALHI